MCNTTLDCPAVAHPSVHLTNLNPCSLGILISAALCILSRFSVSGNNLLLRLTKDAKIRPADGDGLDYDHSFGKHAHDAQGKTTFKMASRRKTKQHCSRLSMIFHVTYLLGFPQYNILSIARNQTLLFLTTKHLAVTHCKCKSSLSAFLILCRSHIILKYNSHTWASSKSL